ncbi:MAG: 4-alpha-glucanotransferase [Candidatus Marinimicrobia bacterium]|nr:4-alpha-glucanotransferase [Candidatus Neomarinimicrobiota bacterium]
MSERLSGILLHVSSLPCAWGKGGFGPEAFRFVDWLERAGQSLWQILPLNYPDPTGSPYTSPSAGAIDPGFVSPEMLAEDGLLSDAELDTLVREREAGHPALRERAFACAYDTWRGSNDRTDFDRFCREHASWLHDTALFMTLRAQYPGTWYGFPEALRDRRPEALAAWERTAEDAVLRFKFEQFILFGQWKKIKDYANAKGIRLIGDIPIFVSGDSADVWSHRGLFKLDEQGVPRVWTGVPPDLFTRTGQLWAQPHYDWEAMKADHYAWWVERVRTGKVQADIIRIDHFRGFCAAYEVPYGAPTAEHGNWVDGPRADVFRVLHERIPGLSIIAEDLGVITPDVVELRHQFRYPGMKILQFAFNSDKENTFLPENFDPDDRFVVYTGTHDNDTVRGWYEHATDEEKTMLAQVADCDASTVAWTLVDMAFHSNAHWAVIPLQDLFNLDSSARMNVPGTIENNWKWQLASFDPPESLTAALRTLSLNSGRNR